MTGRDHALEYLRLLHPAPGLEAVIRFVAMKPRAEPIELYHWAPRCSALDEMLKLNERGYSVFAQVAPCASMAGGGIGNVAYVAALVIDLDLDKFDGSVAPLVEFWDRIGIRPGLRVSSGAGIHLYILLDRPYTVAEAAAVAKRVCYVSFGDPVSNPNRLMRLPGTWNPKYEPPEPCLLARAEEVRYSLEQITAALDGVGAPRIDDLPETGAVPASDHPSEVPTVLEFLAPLWRQVIETGRPPLGWTDMSSLDWAVICQLVQAGASDEQIAAIYASYPVASLKFARSGSAYLSRTIRRARAEVVAEVRQASKAPMWVVESQGLYYIVQNRVKLNREKAREEITNVVRSSSRMAELRGPVLGGSYV